MICWRITRIVITQQRRCCVKSCQFNNIGTNQPVRQRTMQFILHFMKFYSRRPARVLLLTSWNRLVCKHTTGLSLSFHRPNKSPHIVFLFSFASVYTETGKGPVYLHKENEVSATARNDIVFNIFSYLFRDLLCTVT